MRQPIATPRRRRTLRSTLAQSALAVVALMAAGSATAQTARMQPLTGEALAAAAAAYKGWKIDDFVITGAPDHLHDGLQGGLDLAGQSKLFGHDYPRFYPAHLEGDLRRTRLYLAQHGYPYADVAASLRDVASDPPRVAVTLVIAPGRPVRIERLELHGIPDQARDDARDAVGLAEGDAYADPAVKRGADALRDLLMARGHAFAEVVARTATADSFTAHLTYDVTPGPAYTFGDVRISGSSEGLQDVARKSLGIASGDRFSPQALTRARQELRSLDLFRRVRIDVSTVGDDVLDLDVDLTRGEPRTIATSVGYWTDQWFRTRARWTHRNLLKAGRGVSVEASYSRFLRDGQVSAWWPTILGGRTRGTATVRLEAQREEAYHLDSRELALDLTWRPSLVTTWRTGVTISDVDVDIRSDDPDAFQGRGGLLTFLTAGWERNTCTDRMNPRRGWVTWTQLQWGPPGGVTDHHYVLADGSVANFQAFGGQLVWANRVEAGWARALGPSVDLLPNKRFYAGGATSMRGFGRRQLGPVDDDGDPIGGELKFLATTELRFPLFWRLRGAVFLDVGQVWRRRHQVSLAGLSYAVGPGLMLDTPVGPIRADVGRRLSNVHPDEPQLVFHLGIGHPF
jgi:outer membrane protein insertion porin family